MEIQKVCIGIGCLMMVVALLGAFFPGGELFPHSMLSIMSYFALGLILLAGGVSKRKIRARNAALGVGVLMLLLGLGGFLFGAEGIPTHGRFRVDDKLFVLVPGVFEFETLNHMMHLLLGTFLLTTSYIEKKREDAFSKITVYLQARRVR